MTCIPLLALLNINYHPFTFMLVLPHPFFCVSSLFFHSSVKHPSIIATLSPVCLFFIDVTSCFLSNV